MKLITFTKLESQDIESISMVPARLALNEKVCFQNCNRPIWVERTDNHCSTGTVAVLTEDGIRIREVDKDKSLKYSVIAMLKLTISLPAHSEVWFGGEAFYVTEDNNTAVCEKPMAQLPYFEYECMPGTMLNSIDSWLNSWLMSWQTEDFFQTQDIASVCCAR